MYLTSETLWLLLGILIAVILIIGVKRFFSLFWNYFIQYILLFIAAIVVAIIWFVVMIPRITKWLLQGKIVKAGDCVAYTVGSSTIEEIGIVNNTIFTSGEVIVKNILTGKYIRLYLGDIIEKNRNCSTCKYRFKCWTARSYIYG